MFAKLGEFIVRAWPAILIVWLVAVVCVAAIAPPMDRVAQTEEFAFLPASSPSHVAEKLYRKAFPDGYTPSRIVIVARRLERSEIPDDKYKQMSEVEQKLVDEQESLTEDELNFLDDNVDEGDLPIDSQERKLEIREQLLKIADEFSGKDPIKPKIVTGLRSFRDEGTGDLLKSGDGQAVLMLLELPTEFLDSRNHFVIDRIEALFGEKEFIDQKPKGMSIQLSGEGTVGRDMLLAAKNSAQSTELLTVVLVLGLLGAIYRAPLMAIIPLLTVVVAVQFSMSILKLLALYDYVVIFQGIETYVGVLMYGAGVDYCLFLIARYKEEIDAGVSYNEAIANCVAKVGAAIAASAGTVICGIGMMIFAEFGKFHQAGIAISFGLVVVLIASLTFTPAFLRLSGKWAFWPQLRTERVSGGWISSSSLWSRLNEIHWLQNSWDVVGRILIKMPMRIWLASMLLMLPFAIVGVIFYTHLSYGLLSDLSRRSPSVSGTESVRKHYPAGATGSIGILIKNDSVDFSDDETGVEAIEELTKRLREKSGDLQLADVRSVAFPLGGDTPTSELKTGGRRLTQLKAAKKFYVSSAMDNHVTRLDITAEVDPFSRDSIDHLSLLEKDLHDLLPDSLKKGTEIHISGSAASIRDLKAVTDRDQVRIDLLVVAGVFVILVILLRKVALCTYLIVTVLFSYLVALGVTYTFFSTIDPYFAGLDWKVPMFLFTILIAVGEDYNIFLMTRIEEEQLEHGPVKGVIEALSKTGRIISSCGIIMAGTFSSLCSGELKGMVQLGFALAFGVLLDTFVVRPILVPAYLVLLHSGRFGKIGTWLGGPPVPPTATSTTATGTTAID